MFFLVLIQEQGAKSQDELLLSFQLLLKCPDSWFLVPESLFYKPTNVYGSGLTNALIRQFRDKGTTKNAHTQILF
jgi:hypothetical protein